ncbi:MAG: glycosyltransferase family 4 protein, partial [Sphingomonadaceae bacterium]|nr:glycosyltransferase family 4 protein [Sphingomonadaceae bacterium]
MLRVLTLSTLFPDSTRPVFGGFVERQTRGLVAREAVEVEVVAPIGVPPWPLRLHPHYRRLAGVPARERWKGLSVHRPRFAVLPRIGDRHAPALMARRLTPLLRELRGRFSFDVIDAEFFWPDGAAAMRISRALGVPFSVKARGSDIHYWGARRGCCEQMVEAARAAGVATV